MYVLKHGIKQDPARRWALPDRLFFGHGACAILAGVYLELSPLTGFWAERISPLGNFAGNHIYATNGKVAFDYHGYSCRENLLSHHRRRWSSHLQGWDCRVESVDFGLLDTTELKKRKMLGPDQYLHDPIPRARRFIGFMDHAIAAAWPALPFG